MRFSFDSLKPALLVLALTSACAKSDDPDACLTSGDCVLGSVCTDGLCTRQADAATLRDARVADVGRDVVADVRLADATAVEDAPSTDTPADVARDAPDVGPADVGTDAPRIATHIAFVSSTEYPGDFGGLAMADSECQRLADGAGLAGRFVAIMSDATADARDRVGSLREVRDTTGALVADGSGELFGGSIRVRLNHSEAGGNDVGTLVWTGTDSDGLADRGAAHCESWTSLAVSRVGEIGRTDRNDDGWISVYGRGSTTNGCGGTAHIYCIQVNE